MSQNLLSNLDLLHTTQMGAERVRRNLSLNDDVNIVSWCRQMTTKAATIERTGKNWYVHVDHMTLTINAHSYTIITAHMDKSSKQAKAAT